MIPDILTQGQYDTVYNALSLVIASQLFTAVFLLISLPRVLPRYRQAITVALVVCGIAAYHYFRIFDSFKAAFVTDSVGGTGDYTQAAGASFNEGLPLRRLAPDRAAAAGRARRGARPRAEGAVAPALPAGPGVGADDRARLPG